MGGNVADFVAIRDAGFVLESTPTAPRAVRNFSFGLPGDTLVGQDSILSFMLLSSAPVPAGSGGPTLSVSINDTEVFNRSLGTAIDRCYQEVCPRRILIDGTGNDMLFVVAGGRCEISDVVLWFQNAT